MCYDISFGTRYELITDYLPDIILDAQLDMNFPNVLHVQAQHCSSYPVIVYCNGRHHLTPLHWGVRMGSALTVWNATAEKILDPESPWYNMRGDRCLIPVSGIYEHRKIEGWKKKVPYYVQQKARPLMGIPALYSRAQNTFTMVTRAAVNNDIMRNIHNDSERGFRMPLFLPKAKELLWLKQELTDAEIQTLLDFEMPSEDLQYQAVFTIRTEKPHPKGGAKTDPFNWPNLPPLGQDTNELFLF